MKRHGLEWGMGILLLLGAFLLSGEAARVISSSRVARELIVVDPGHGGMDPGMVGVGGLQEKDLNLAISLKLRDCLEKEGFQVLLTRESDIGLYQENTVNKKVQDLQRRCAFIAEKEPALTVSIHQNSYSDESVCGPQVFYYDGSAEGEELAAAIQEQMNRQLEIRKPRAPKGNTTYFLLKKSKGALVIAECGFLSNPAEAGKLSDETYQQKVAQAVCDGVKEYLERKNGG